jgi:hypothetical protein
MTKLKSEPIDETGGEQRRADKNANLFMARLWIVIGAVVFTFSLALIYILVQAIRWAWASCCK